MQHQSPKAIIGRLDLELLMAFVTIVECGSFTRAAQRLNLTQSAVSMQIKRLEDRVGRRLLYRYGRRLEMTEPGQLLHRYARRIVDLEEDARVHLSMPPLAGSIRIGVPEWFTGYKLQRLLAEFRRTHPDVHLVMRADASWELRDAVKSGQLDLALAIVEPCEDAPAPAYSERLQWVVGAGQPLDVTGEMPVALFDPPCPYRTIAMEGLETCGWRGREVFTSASVASVRTAVETGLGISVFPESAVSRGLRILGETEGFPQLPYTELGIYRSPRIEETPAAHLCTYLEESLGRDAAISQPF